jgi:hypothetical protein
MIKKKQFLRSWDTFSIIIVVIIIIITVKIYY